MNQSEEITSVRPSIIRVIAFLDNVPLVTPLLVKPGTLYSLKFTLCGENWPSDAHKLVLNLITTCPVGAYNRSEFILSRPTQSDNFRAELTGQIVFNASLSLLADNLVFAIRCAYFNNKECI